MKTMKVFDFQLEGGKRVSEEASHLWTYYEYGNDHYYHETTLNDLKELEVKSEVFVFDGPDGNMLEPEYRGYFPIRLKMTKMVEYLESCDVEPKEKILIHWWW